MIENKQLTKTKWHDWIPCFFCQNACKKNTDDTLKRPLCLTIDRWMAMYWRLFRIFTNQFKEDEWHLFIETRFYSIWL